MHYAVCIYKKKERAKHRHHDLTIAQLIIKMMSCVIKLNVFLRANQFVRKLEEIIGITFIELLFILLNSF